SIVIKCPACGEKFQAEREAEASFVSCPQCDIQVKISGMEEPRNRKSRLLPHISQLPAQKQLRQNLKFQDLARRGTDTQPLKSLKTPDQPPSDASKRSRSIPENNTDVTESR